MEYREYPRAEAYKLQNAGGLVLVCTKGADGRYDLAPVAWCCPADYAPVSRLICVLDSGHRTYEDLAASGRFALALPTKAQKNLVMSCGSVSGKEKDKYAAFGIEAFPGRVADVRVPLDVAGWIECAVAKVIVEGTSAMVLGEALYAAAAEEFWRERLHYVNESLFFAPGETV